jgi:hypothetical protein
MDKLFEYSFSSLFLLLQASLQGTDPDDKEPGLSVDDCVSCLHDWDGGGGEVWQLAGLWALV